LKPLDKGSLKPSDTFSSKAKACESLGVVALQTYGAAANSTKVMTCFNIFKVVVVKVDGACEGRETRLLFNRSAANSSR